MQRFLIIYQEIPENTTLYLLETDDEPTIGLVRSFQNQFVNGCDCIIDYNDVEDVLGKASKLYEANDDALKGITKLDGPLEVIMTGFIL